MLKEKYQRVLKKLRRILKMRFKKAFIFFSISAVLIFSFVSVFSKEVSVLKLVGGKNAIEFDLGQPIYAETLVKLNPSIEAISYTENNKTIGYVNIFGGIGKNFIIEKGKQYEVIVKEDLDLVLPGGEEK